MQHNGVWHSATIGALDAGSVHGGLDQMFYFGALTRLSKWGTACPKVTKEMFRILRSSSLRLHLIHQFQGLYDNSQSLLGHWASHHLLAHPVYFINHPALNRNGIAKSSLNSQSHSSFLCGKALIGRGGKAKKTNLDPHD